VKKSVFVRSSKICHGAVGVIAVSDGEIWGQEAVKKLSFRATDRRQLPEVVLPSDITRVHTFQPPLKVLRWEYLPCPF
jgi:hypothetical protein